MTRIPPAPPEELLRGVGTGDFEEIGRRTVGLVERLAKVRPQDRVLDVGCGLGRTAWPLSEKLGPQGSYVGLDVVRDYVDWCAGSLGLDPKRFRFHHADVRTSFYNPGGSIAAEDFVFPWPDGSFDLAIATSIFTHLLWAATARYLHEIARTLSPGGRLFASFYLLDARGREAAATLATYPTFGAATEHGLLHDPSVPESAVAYDPDWLFGQFAAAGLDVAGVHMGRWKALPGLDHQDLVVAVRPLRRGRSSV